MVQALNQLSETPSQTAGPYVHIGLMPNHCGIAGVYGADLGAAMIGQGAKGQRIRVKGHIYDGAGASLKDALIEIWQADAAGLYNSPAEKRGQADPAFSGFGRLATDGSHGEYGFETIKPGRAPFVDGRLMAPHITFWIVARGINIGLHTRMYFADEGEANARVPGAGAHRTPPPRADAVCDPRGGRRHADLSLRRPSAGRARNDLFRYLTAQAMAVAAFDHPILSSLFGDAETARYFSLEAEIEAMLRFEAALALAQAEVGLIPAAAASRIAERCQDFRADVASLAQAFARDGVVVPGLVKALSAHVGGDAAAYTHYRATSQDVVDSGLVLRLRPALAVFETRICGFDLALAKD